MKQNLDDLVSEVKGHARSVSGCYERYVRFDEWAGLTQLQAAEDLHVALNDLAFAAAMAQNALGDEIGKLKRKAEKEAD
ncbi:MAG: hypothetical protein KGL39_05670 [Patescibacteria group bacterium]|nr:hypothetical protein [Patescibacteria group bacterium]